MDLKDQNIPHNPNPNEIGILDPVYAQLVVLSTNQYDTTLVFSQLQPVIKPGEKNVIMIGKEVARVVIPPQTANELKELFINLKMPILNQKKG